MEPATDGQRKAIGPKKKPTIEAPMSPQKLIENEPVEVEREISPQNTINRWNKLRTIMNSMNRLSKSYGLSNLGRASSRFREGVTENSRTSTDQPDDGTAKK